mgnify:CR=1 FL=1
MGNPDLVAASRSFIRQGSLKKKSSNGHDKRYEFFLFKCVACMCFVSP